MRSVFVGKIDCGALFHILDVDVALCGLEVEGHLDCWEFRKLADIDCCPECFRLYKARRKARARRMRAYRKE